MTDKSQILIVEDDLDLSDMVTSYFRAQNFDVLTAAWGEEALKLAEDSHLDLIMLDIRLPDIDGFELCRRLRLQRKTQDVPILFLTEKRDRVDKLQGLELGVVDYITKPFDIQELRLRVRNAINRSQTPVKYNPVTDLPEGEVVVERLEQLLKREEDWALLQFSIERLSEFRERYGFVAADDVLRAVTLMVRNAVQSFGGTNDFIGHLGTEHFVIITEPDKVDEIRERVERRISQSREYFYPLKDRDRARQAMEENHLRLVSGTIDKSAGPFETVTALREALSASIASGPA